MLEINDMRKKRLPGYTSKIKSRCEELADKICGVSNDRPSVMGALLEIRDASFEEGYERKGFDLAYQREVREEKRKKDWLKWRDKIIFREK